ncbi:Putative protein of unknown function [Podospora comata]|uniref:Uncharacterized protein n=1 Tax=Podospora comata TaxID=48703 RepID=A0ABY6S8M0_PODCO|nr:Putative protein of unknown function [Podospora comata]
MKQGLAFVSAFGLLQLASAACCRTNKCFKAVADPLVDGLQDCSLALEIVTVTPQVTTVTETVTEVPTQYVSVVETDATTATVYSTVETQTLLNTISTTVTCTTTQHSLVYVTHAYNTVTVLVTSTTTVLPSAATQIVARSADTDLAPTSGTLAPSIPSYASAHCPSWEKYISVCKCAGATQETIIVSPSAATMTVTFTDSVAATTIPIPVTLSTTTTVIDEVTTTEYNTQTETASVTATAVTTVTGNVLVMGSTTTVTSTITSTVVAPAERCSNVANFNAVATDSANSQRYLFSQLNNGMAGLYGSMDWASAPVEPVIDVYKMYKWVLDEEGYLATLYLVGQSTYKVSAWVSPGSAASVRLQARTGAEYSPANYIRVKGCVSTATGELTLDVGGRKSILLCGNNQVFLSSGDGSDTGLSCTRMYPRAITV